MYLVAITVCGLGLLLYLIHGKLAPALTGGSLDTETDEITNEKRQRVMVWTMINKWTDEKATLTRLGMPVLVDAWLKEQMPSIARHDASWFEKQGQPATATEEKKLISDAVQRALDVTNFWARKAEQDTQNEESHEEEVED